MKGIDRFVHRMTRSDLVRRTYTICRSIPGLGLGIQTIVRTALPIGTRLWLKIPAGAAKDFWMYADLRNESGYTNGDHEPWLQDLLLSELSPGGCYYDVGAHSGFFCLAANRQLGPHGVIVAIEADPGNAAILRANIARNQLSQITVLEVAIWSSTGQITFQQDLAESNRTGGHISHGEDTLGSQISVPAASLDDLIFSENRRIPDLVKMDIEGAEWEALQGARRLLSEVRPKLLCEIHDPTQLGLIREYLEQFGYVAEEWKPVHPHYADYRQLYVWAVPR